MLVRASRLVIVLCLALVSSAAAVGCAAGTGATQLEYLDDRVGLDFAPQRGAEATAWRAWLDGDSAAAADALGAQPSTPTARFLAAELAMQRGHYARSAEYHAELVAASPTHPLARFSLRRLARLIELVGDPSPIASVLTPATWQAAGAEERLVLARISAVLDERRALLAGELAQGWGAVGGLSRWRWVGPFDIFDQAGFDTAYAPEDEAVLGERYRSADGLRELVRQEETFGGVLTPSVSQTGVYYLESFFEVGAPTEVVVALRGVSEATVWIDGELVLERDDDVHQPPEESARLVSFSPGRHRVLLKIGVGQRAAPQLLLVPTRGAPPFALAAAEPAPPSGSAAPGLALRLRGGLPEDLAELAAEPFYLWLATMTASDTGEHARGVLAADLGLAQAERFVPLLLAEAELVRADAAIDPTTGLNLATDAWRRALDIDPDAGHARLMLGHVLNEQGQYEKSLSHLDAYVAQAPQEYRGHFHRYLTLTSVGWTTAADLALAEAYAAHPESCELALAVIDRDAQRRRFPTPDTVPSEVARCPGVREALVRYHHLPRGDLDTALGIYTDLVEQFPTEVGYLRSLGTLLAQAGRTEEALAAYEEAGKLLRSDGADHVAHRVDLLFATGKRDDARALLERELAANPAQLELVELMRAFGGERVLAELRVDGLAVVKDYLADETRNYTQSAFYLLDYAAFRYFPDGSSLAVTHQITRVLNKDAKNRLGEVQIPPGAVVTQLRTIKADGRTTVEPEFIAHKPTVSMPNLEVGDFIEFEYIVASGPRVRGESGFVVPRWYFQIMEAPLMYSELVVEIPAEATAVLDVRGAVPDPEITPSADGRFRRYRWLMTEMLDPRPEPGAPTMVEIVPSVQLAAHIDGEQMRRALRNDLLSTTRPTPQLEEAARLAAAGATEPREIARRMFTFVKSEIVDVQQPFAMPASWIWTARKGSRLMLLKALLDIAGVENDIVVVKPFGAPEGDSPVSVMADYAVPVLRVEVGGDRPLWLDPSQTWARFDYLSPALQGRPGIVLGPEDGERVVVHDYDDAIDRTVLSFDLILGEDGTLAGMGSETSDGVAGTGLRNFISRFQSDPDEIMERLAGYLGSSFGRTTVTDVDYVGFEDDGAISIRFSFNALGLASREDDGSIVLQGSIFPSELSNTFAQMPTRQQALLIGQPVFSEIEIGLTLPPGMTITEAPSEDRIESAFGSYTRSVVVRDGQVRLIERLDVPQQRIAPSDYAAFREFARSVDQAQTLRLAVR